MADVSKLSQLRRGLPPHKQVIISGQKFEVVIVSTDIIKQCEEDTELYANQNEGKMNDRLKNLYYDTLLVYHCLRDADDPTLQTKAASNHTEVRQTLDVEDITRITTAYGELMMDKAPKIELLNDEEINDIKKYLEETPLSDLSTVSLVHLANFHQTIVSNQ